MRRRDVGAGRPATDRTNAGASVPLRASRSVRDPSADPGVPAARRRARRTVAPWTTVAATRRVGRPAGQHAARGVAVDPRPRGEDDPDHLGGSVARPALGPALQRVRRGCAGPGGLLARPPARRREGPQRAEDAADKVESVLGMDTKMGYGEVGAALGVNANA